MRLRLIPGLVAALVVLPAVSSVPVHASAPLAPVALQAPNLPRAFEGTLPHSVPNPDPSGVDPATSTLTSVSCVSASFCMAVGWTFESFDPSIQIWTYSTLAEEWNGSSWKILPTPAPPNSSGQLLGVSCVSSTNCVAVGTDNTQLGISETWNGESWQMQATPDPDGIYTQTYLDGITCVSSVLCTAVGWIADVRTVAYTLQPLVLTGNGSTWSIQPSPSSSTTENAYLAAISCSGPAACTALGVGGPAFAERWDGSAWTIESMPDTSTGSPQLTGVSCPSDVNCVAVGFDETDTNNVLTATTLAETWNGIAWSITPMRQPNGSKWATLNAVTCSSATACTAVGGSDITGPLAESWNGARWARQSTPDRTAHPTPGTDVTAAEGISCSTPITCIAVGYLDQSASTTYLLALASSGQTWSAQPVPEPDTASTLLSGVACPTSRACLSVGEFLTPTLQEPVVETRAKATWSIEAVPMPGAGYDGWLTSLSCPSPVACIAVGSYEYAGGGGDTSPFADAWNGTKWRLLPAIPTPATLTASLHAISCTAEDNCTAVGFTSNDAADSQLIEAWNGSKWSIQPPPTGLDVIGSELSGVSCLSAQVCFTTGWEVSQQGAETVLIEAWDGATWNIEPAPGLLQGQLTSVSCTSSTFCMTVGDIVNPSAADQPSALVWDGTSWSLSPEPGPSGFANALNGVSCFSASMCMGVGAAADPAEEWTGSTWVNVPAPSVPGSASAELSAVFCTHTAVCSAVGSDTLAGVTFFPVRTLAELWEGQSWRIQATGNAN
jgi:hypothetical protein